MRRRIGRAGAIVALVALVTGCGVTVYEPGVYKGETDPLLAKLAQPELKAQLQERFTEGQAQR